jgi:hypothetical protein
MQFRFVPRSAWALLLLFALLAAVAAWPGRVIVAQTPQQSQLLQVNYVQLKPETAPQWADLQRNELIPAQKKGGLAWRETWAGGNTGDVYLRAIVTPITSLAQYDGQAPIVKALGEQGARAFGEKNRRLITGSHGYIVRTRPDLGFGMPPAKPNIMLLSTVTVANGRNGDFESFIKADVAPALKKANVNYYTVSQVVYGGDANQYFTLIPFSNFAELAKGHPLERALGADGMMRLGQKSGPSVLKLERTIIRYLADLSYGAPMTSSQ